MRVHGIARRTLFDPMHDEQPFSSNLTERRRTTVKFLGQQSELLIDDTWPQAGEMRSLWKGTTEFWTSDMPHDDTWEPDRHTSSLSQSFDPRHSSYIPFISRILLPQLSMSAGIPLCLLCYIPRMPRKKEEAWFWGYTVCTVITTMIPLMARNVDDKGEITEANKSIHRVLTSEEEKRGSSQNSGGTICPTGTGDGKDAADHEIIGGEIRASRSMKTGQKRRLLGGIKKTDRMRKMVRNYRGGGETTELHGRHSTVHRFL